MRTIIITSLLIALLSCSGNQVKQAIDEISFTAISAEFPLNLGEINFNDKSKEIRLNSDVSLKIDTIIKNFADEIIWDERFPHTYMDAYINTICLKNDLHTIYLVLLKYFPRTETVSGMALFYDNRKDEFIEGSFELGIYFLYHYYDNKLNPSNLKTELNIAAPDIELIDFDMDGVNDYMFTCLSHNGTYNAIVTEILTTKNSAIDTLYFDERSLLEL